MNLKEATEIVCKDRPEFAKIIEENISTSVCAYYKNTQHTEPVTYSILIEILIGLAQKRNITVDTTLIKQTLQTSFRVGTADHHGPFGHPFFFHNTLMEQILADDGQVTILLPCAGVSLDNSSFPRGILFHATDGTLIRIPFFPSSQHREPVYGMNINTQAMRKHAQKNLRQYDSILSLKIKNKLLTIIDQVLPHDEMTTYEVALSGINERLWNLVDPNKTSPVVIDQESVVVEYICQQLGTNKTLSALLTDTNIHKSFLKHFDSILGAFDSKKNTGTHLFWYRAEHAREQMYLKETTLVTETGNKVLLTKDHIIEALKNKKIYPSMALTFIILCGLEGLRTDGGFSQVNYLKEILTQYDKMVKDSDGILPEREKKIYPSVFRGEITIAPFKLAENTVQATLIDLILYAPTDWKKVVRAYSEKLSLTNSIYGMMESFYKITTGHAIQISDAPVPEPLWYANTENTKK